MRKTFAVLFALGLLAGCAGGPNLPPKAGPEEVELIDPQMGQEAREGYETIGPVTVRAPLGTPQPDLMTMLRTRAAELGADAVIYQGTQRSTEGEVSGGVDREEELIVNGLAIYWPTGGTGGGA